MNPALKPRSRHSEARGLKAARDRVGPSFSAREEGEKNGENTGEEKGSLALSAGRRSGGSEEMEDVGKRVGRKSLRINGLTGGLSGD